MLIPPPILYAVTFAAGMGLERLATWAPAWTRAPALHGLGWVLAGCGAVLALASAGMFGLRRTTLKPWGRAAQLVDSGPFALSRNPMYVSLTLAYLGLALGLGKFWPLVLLILPVAVMNAVVIPFEEARMRDAFGQSYADYCRRVRRWV